MRKNSQQTQIKPKKYIKIPSQLNNFKIFHRSSNQQIVNIASKHNIPSMDYDENEPLTSRRKSINLMSKIQFIPPSQRTQNNNFRVSGAGFRRKKILSQLKSIKKPIQKVQSCERIIYRQQKKQFKQQYKFQHYFDQQIKIVKPKYSITIQKQNQKKLNRNKQIHKKLKSQTNSDISQANIIDLVEQDEKTEFQSDGFGVTNDLSNYDFICLDDMNGNQFCQKYAQKKGKCPVYKDNKYKWVDVQVKGFDKSINKAIVKQIGSKEVKKISRMSLLFNQNNNQQNYWKRVSEAKQLRKKVRQNGKYMRYIDNQVQKFQLQQKIKKQYPQNLAQIIEIQCHQRYCRQFLVYNQMYCKPDFFKEIGIKIRKFIHFKNKNQYKNFTNFQQKVQKISCLHYTKIQSIFSSLEGIIKKFAISNCIIWHNQYHKQSLDSFKQNFKKHIDYSINKFITRDRQIIISNVLYKNRDKFTTKKQQMKYMVLLNYVFSSTIICNVYQANINYWIKYLQSFIQQNISSHDPFIQVDLVVNKKKNYIEAKPSQSQFKEANYNIIEHFEMKMKQFPDLLEQLLKRPKKTILIYESYLPRIKQIIKIVSQYSFKTVNLFIKKMQPYLKYLQKISFQTEEFTMEHIEYYQLKIKAINQDLQQVQRSFLRKSGLIIINLNPLKQILIENIEKNKKNYLKLIEKLVIKEVLQMKQKFKKMQEKLNQFPINEDQLIKMKKFININCQQFMNIAKIHSQCCQSYYILLEKYFHIYDHNQYQNLCQIIILHNNFSKKMSVKVIQLIQIQSKFIENINIDREEVLKCLDETKDNIQMIKNLSNYNDLRQNYISTSKLNFILEQNLNKLISINYRQKILGQQLSEIPVIQQLLNEIKPYYEMWNNIYNFTQATDDWFNKPIMTLDSKKINHMVNNVMLKELDRLSKIFINAKNQSAFAICQISQQKVRFVKNKLWAIQSFTAEGMKKKPNLIKQVLNKICGTKIDVNKVQITLEQLISYGLNQHQEYIETTAKKANKIWKLEQGLSAIIVELKKLYFEIKDQKQIFPIINEETIQDCFSVLNIQEDFIEIIKSDPEAEILSKKINTINGKIHLFESTLKIIIIFQKDFFKLTKVFQIYQIYSELPQEKSKIDQIMKTWVTIVTHLRKDMQLWQGIDSQSYRNRLSNAISILSQIKINLNKILSEKRLQFPRLFFISDQKLLKMLTNNDYKYSAREKQLLLSGIIDLTLENDSHFVQALGTNNQVIKLKNPIRKNTILWDKFKYILNQVQKAVRDQFLPLNEKNNNLFLRIIFNQLCDWTNKMQTSIKQNTVHQYLESFISKLGVPIRDNRQQCMRMHQLCLRDIMQNIRKENIRSLNNFQWAKHIRFYKEEQRINIKTASLSVKVGDEYQGNTPKMILLPSNRKTIHVIIAAKNIGIGNLLTNGGHELIRDFSSMLLYYSCEMMIKNQSKNTSELTHILKGAHLSKCWCCLLIDEILNTNILNIISQSVCVVQQSIRKQIQLVQFLGSKLPLSSVRSSLIFLEPLNSVEKFLDDNKNNYLFRTSFRPIAIFIPTWSILIKLKLQSIGISKIQIAQIMCLLNKLPSAIKQWSVNYQLNLVSLFLNLNIQKLFKNSQQAVNMFYEFINHQLNRQELLQIGLSGNQNNSIQKLKDSIQIIHTDLTNHKVIIVIGNHLSGRSTAIKTAFSDLKIVVNLKYQQKQAFNEWILVQDQWGINHIPADQKTVLQVTNLEWLPPSLCGSVLIIHLSKSIQLVSFIKKQVCQIPLQVPKIQTQSHINIFISNYRQLLSQQNLLVLIISICKMIISFIKCDKMPSSAYSVREIIYMILIWNVFVFDPMIKPDPKKFGSCLVTNNIQNYFYDTQKLVWLDWTVINDHAVFKPVPINYYDIFLPLNQTISTLYFLSACSKQFNITIVTSEAAIGKTTLICNWLKENSKIFQRVNLNFYIPSNRISKMLNMRAHCRNSFKQYCIQQNKELVIFLDDMHLIYDNQPKFDKINILLRYNYDVHTKKIFTNLRFITTLNLNGSHNNLQKNILTYLLPIYLRKPSYNSTNYLFCYILDWFFGNTENPFSKQVRDMTDVIVSLSILLHQYFSVIEIKFNFTKFGNFCKIFYGITKASPKTTKSQEDILRIWNDEVRRVLMDAKIINQFQQHYQFVIKKYLAQHNVSTEISKILQQILSTEYPTFCNLNKDDLQYGDCYKKINFQTIKDYIQNIIKIQFQKNWSLCFVIIFEEFIYRVLKIMRVLSIPQGFMLLYGHIAAGKKTAIQVSSLIKFGMKSPIISHKTSDSWKNQLIKNFKKTYEQKINICLIIDLQREYQKIFNVDSDSLEFLFQISQLLENGEPRSLLYDNKFEYLHELNIETSKSTQYQQLIDFCRNHVHYIICMSTSNLNIVQQIPSFLTRMQGTNIIEDFDDKNILQISKNTIGKYFTRSQICLQMHHYIYKIYKEKQIKCERRNQQFFRWMKISLLFYQQTQCQIKVQQEKLFLSIKKVQLTQQQKQMMENQLQTMRPKLQKIKIQAGERLKDFNQAKLSYQDKLLSFEQSEKKYNQQKQQVHKIERQVQFQLAKVLPMLKLAEQSFSKVTRDDINQLRSFPNPPLAAVKVVKALIFIFQEENLVMQKINSQGLKFKDYWQYAKKFVLNDKLLKRVSEFKPDYIKNLDIGMINILETIIQQPEFKQERVFKASQAAGNLSLWMKAVVATFNIMQVIQPKKQQLNIAVNKLKQFQEFIQKSKQILSDNLIILQKKQSFYTDKTKQQSELQNKINNLEKQIEKSGKLLELLKKQLVKWQYKKDVTLKKIAVTAQIHSILCGFQIIFLGSFGQSLSADILKNTLKLLNIKEYNDFLLSQNYSLEYIREQVIEIFNEIDNKHIFTLDQTDNIIILLKKIKFMKQIVIIDEVETIFELLSNINFCNLHNLEIKVLDCLKYDEVSSLIQDISGQNNEDENGEQIIVCQFSIKIILFKNAEHNEIILANLNTITQYCVIRCLLPIFIMNKTTEELKRQCIKINIYNTITDSLLQESIGPIVGIPSKKRLQMKHYSFLKKQNEMLIQILLKFKNIVSKESYMEKWLDVWERIELEGQLKTFKTNELHQQVLQQIIRIPLDQAGFSSRLHQIKSYMTGKTQEAIWTLEQHLNLTRNISNHNQINIIYSHECLSNPILYLIQNYPNISHLTQVPNSAQIQYYLTNQHQVVIFISSKGKALKLAQKLTQIYEKYINRQNYDYDFENEYFKFFIILSAKQIPKQMANYNLIQYTDTLYSSISIQHLKYYEVDNLTIIKQFKKKHENFTIHQIKYLIEHVINTSLFLQYNQTKLYQQIITLIDRLNKNNQSITQIIVNKNQKGQSEEIIAVNNNFYKLTLGSLNCDQEILDYQIIESIIKYQTCN